MSLRKCKARVWDSDKKATVEVDAIFHEWGTTFRQEDKCHNDGYQGWEWLTYSVGIIELLDGTISMVDPTDVTFTDSQAVAERLKNDT